MPGGGLAWVMRGVGIIWGRVAGVACGMLGVACVIRGVPPAAWLWWLWVDMLTAMGTDMGRDACATDGGRDGLLAAAMLELDGCIDTDPTMGDDMSAGVGWRRMGEGAWVAWVTCGGNLCGVWVGMPLVMTGVETGALPLAMPFGFGTRCAGCGTGVPWLL